MAKNENNHDAPFNFGNSPLIQQTEQKMEDGYQRIESEEQKKQQQEEETKGIQAYIPMSLYERLVMRKLKTKEPLGSMFVQALRLWVDVQEGKSQVNKVI